MDGGMKRESKIYAFGSTDRRWSQPLGITTHVGYAEEGGGIKHMQVRIYVGLVGLVAIVFSSACTSLGKGVQQSKQKTTVGQRVERFAKSLTQTVTDVASDVLPILGATTKEVVDEIKSDLPKVAEELGSQMSHSLPTRGSRESGH